MKRLLLAAVLVAIVAPTAPATPTTDCDVYCQELCLWKLFPGIIDATWTYEHANPAEQPLGPYTPADYEELVETGQICDVKLTITADDLDKGDEVTVKIQRQDTDAWQTLGCLTTMDWDDWDWLKGPIPGPSATMGHRTVSVFSINPVWLDGLPVKLKIEGGGLFCPNGVEIEKSKLCVSVCPIPAPGALLLGSLGVALVGAVRRRWFA